MTDAERQLVAALAVEARGPRRNGLLALWLVTRAAEAVLPPDPVSTRNHRRRVDQLQRRLSSVSVPSPLRRALPAALRLVSEGTPRAAALALHQLVAPARECLGASAADAIAVAAAHARTHAPESRSR